MGWSISAKNLEHEQQVQASVIQKRPTSQILGHQSQEFSHHKGVSTPRQFGGTKRLQNPKNSRCRKLILSIYKISASKWPFQASCFPAGPTSVDTWSTLGFPAQPFFSTAGCQYFDAVEKVMLVVGGPDFNIECLGISHQISSMPSAWIKCFIHVFFWFGTSLFRR